MSRLRFLPALFLLSLLLAAASAQAAAPVIPPGGKPIQISLFNPIQILPEKESVSGIRINLIYGKNENVQGLDWGLVNHTTGSELAWQVGAFGYVEKDFFGWQDNYFANITNGEFTGFQSGIFNQATTANGVEFGLVNVTQNMHGIQIGLLNMTQTMHGLQIGVGNIIQKGKMPFLPIVNWSL